VAISPANVGSVGSARGIISMSPEITKTYALMQNVKGMFLFIVHLHHQHVTITLLAMKLNPSAQRRFFIRAFL
jgi:hypothetical protein